MKRTTPLAVALLLLLSAVLPAAAADDSPKAIIERAIKAHGGQERLEKVKADRVTVKGVIMIGDKPVDFSSETTVNLPSQLRSVTKLMIEGKPQTVVNLLNGDDVIVTINGQPQPRPPASAVQEVYDTMLLNRIERLTTLLSDKAVELTALGESMLDDKPVVGVQVRLKKHSDVKAFFDKESGLLVKTEHVHDDGAKKVKQEERYSDFKDFDGFKRATKTVVTRDGKKFLEMDVADVKYLDKVDETLFTKP
jgi:hypothetical protein